MLFLLITISPSKISVAVYYEISGNMYLLIWRACECVLVGWFYNVVFYSSSVYFSATRSYYIRYTVVCARLKISLYVTIPLQTSRFSYTCVCMYETLIYARLLCTYAISFNDEIFHVDDTRMYSTFNTGSRSLPHGSCNFAVKEWSQLRCITKSYIRAERIVMCGKSRFKYSHTREKTHIRELARNFWIETVQYIRLFFSEESTIVCLLKKKKNERLCVWDRHINTREIVFVNAQNVLRI